MMRRTSDFGTAVARGEPSRDSAPGTVARGADRPRRRNAMTVDVEDFFQVQAFAGTVDRASWETWPRRVESNTDKILALFAEHDVKATFFTLGWIAERHPGLIRRIVDQGHELASHGYEHIRVFQQDAPAFRADVQRTKKLLEDIGGTAVRGYRAASFSVTEDTLWALSVLAEEGYDYSSSIYPVVHDHYGIPRAPRFAFHPRDDRFLEIPLTTMRVLGQNLPCSGGGYFRLFPYALSRLGLRRVNEHDGQSCVFYFHPWEIDPEQPRMAGLPVKTRFRHYLNLNRMEGRLRRLLADFAWSRMDRVFLGADA
jgi:polysaccharide deacetylase family protein (PEP-CTERM system associated)